jgi:hypothetical protein
MRDSKGYYKRVPRAKDSKITKIKDSLESLNPQAIPTYRGGNLPRKKTPSFMTGVI